MEVTDGLFLEGGHEAGHKPQRGLRQDVSLREGVLFSEKSFHHCPVPSADGKSLQKVLYSTPAVHFVSVRVVYCWTAAAELPF